MFEVNQQVVLSVNVYGTFYVLAKVEQVVGDEVQVSGRWFDAETGVEREATGIPHHIYEVTEESISWVHETEARLLKDTLLRTLEETYRFRELSLPALQAVCKILEGETPLFIDWEKVPKEMVGFAMDADGLWFAYRDQPQVDEDTKQWLTGRTGISYRSLDQAWLTSLIPWRESYTERPQIER